MGYTPSRWQQFKEVIKKNCTNIGKKNPVFKKMYEAKVLKSRQKRFAQFTSLPVDKHTVIFESFQARRYADSPRAIYEYMLKSPEYGDYSFIWMIRGSIIDDYEWLNHNDRTRVVRYGSDEYYKTYATAGYWFSNSRIVNGISPRPEQTYVQCWHGTPLKRLAYDIEVKGANDLNSKADLCKVYTLDAKKYTYMLSPSAFCTEKFRSAFNLGAIGKWDIMVEEGYPRNDFLKTYTDEDIKRVKEAIGIPETKKVILYAPTWRDDQHIAGTGYVFDNPLDFDELRERISDEYVVLFRPHYFIANAFDFEQYEGFVYDVAKYPEINDLYIVSDVLITDYSSVFFDYSILRRPIIYYMYDLDKYKDTVRGFYISLDELPGPIVTEQEDLFDKIDSIGEWTQGQDYKDKYDAFSNKFTYLDDGHAAERVVKRIIG